MRTAVTDMLGIDEPLLGFNRSPAVVTAVTRAGGLGVLAATGYTPEQLDAQLTWIEEQLDGRPYGVDLLVGRTTAGDPAALIESLRAQIPEQHIQFVQELLRRYDIPPARTQAGGDMFATNVDPSGIAALLDVVFAHPIALVANALGPPPPSMVERARNAGIPVASLCGRPDHARSQLAAGVDLLVAQGTEAGGHTGTIATMVLTPEIVEIAGDVPVVAAGGIASGQQMAAALALGAAGVWCGSVWLASEEEITPIEIKRKFLAATSSDTVRSKTRTGKPARQLRSAWHDEWERPDSPAALPMPLQPLLVTDAWASIEEAAAEGSPGGLALQSWFVGQVVGGFTELRPAEEIARAIIDDCRERLAAMGRLATTTHT